MLCTRAARSRKLPAASLVLFCIAMNLYSTDCLTHVFFRLVSGLRWLLADPDDWRVSKGALSQARYRLGARPLAALFRRVCSDKPLAEPDTTPEAFLFGLRLMALDSTVLNLPDTPQNVRAFGRPASSPGTSAWPQAPRRLSFTGTLRLIRELIPEVQRTAAVDHPRLYRQLLADIAATPLRPRTNRTNPRVVKRKMSKFRVKNPEHHRHWPQPSKPFREAIVLLN